MALRREHVLMDEAGDPGDGGGGDPPKDPPKDSDGDPPKDPEKNMLSRDSLPEDLRDRPEAEIKFLVDHMITTLGTRNSEVEDLKTQIAELRGAVSVQPPTEPDPNDAKPMEELILEDAEAALDRWASKRGYLGVMGDLSDRVGEAEFSMIRSEIDDFHTHEDAVRKLLKDGRIPATRAAIEGAYKIALGESVIAEREREARKNSSSIPPSNAPPPDPDKEAPTLTALEVEVAAAHGITDPAEWVKYRDNEMELKLPV